jgi:lysophospholipase L1-like esterase
MNRKDISMKKLLVIILILGISVSTSLASDFNKTASGMELADGDVVVFIGNSITHQCLYTQYIENYFYTRMPHLRIHFHNAGVSGDVAADVLRRLEEDVAVFQPKYTSILIGMNDGRYQDFDQEIFKTYKTDMSLLLDRLDTLGTNPILITPTMYDLRPALMGDNWLDKDYAQNIHYNATLAFFGAWALQTANDRGFGYVNMYEPLNRITRQNRKEDPEFTLIKDSVHPGSDGQLVMALAFLRDIEADPVVSSIHLELNNNGWEVVKTEKGEIKKLRGKGVRFEFKAESLPWVVPEKASLGYKLTQAGNKMSREMVRITGLDAGVFTLLIDGKPVGSYSHLQFSQGIQLQENALTPQHQQAVKIAELNKKRNDEAVRPMRDLWLGRKLIWRFNNAPDDFDDEAEKEETRKELIKYFGSLEMEPFLKLFQEELVPLKQKARDLEDQIYKINTPVSHTYEIFNN